MKRPLTNSDALWERSRAVIPCGTQTLSKGPDQFVNGVYPKFISHGRGSHVFDEDGNEFIDYPSSLGSILLGHAYPAVVDAVRARVGEGIAFTLPHRLEVELAEALTSLVPCAEMVRFCKNGSDATSGAVRLARACTGREKIAFCGYHGWQDWYVISTARTDGVPRVLSEYIFKFEYNDLSSLEAIMRDHGHEIAAVIMEPVGIFAPQAGFLEGVRELATRHGALLIFDEIITGFRFSLGGAQQYFGVTPDLACVGKGMGNGMPISGVVGKRQYMQEFSHVFFSGTFFGDTVAIAAALATIGELTSRDVLGHIWALGERLKSGFNEAAARLGVDVTCEGFAPRTKFFFRDAEGRESNLIKSLFMQEMIERGVLIGAAQLVTYSHTAEDIDHTLAAAEEALAVVRDALAAGAVEQRLRGNPIGIIFRQV